MADFNSTPTFEQMPQALAEVLSQIRLIKEVVMNGSNSNSAGHGSHVLVGIDRACEITGKSKHTLYRYTSRRQIPFCKKGRTIYFFEDKLYEWIESGQRETLQQEAERRGQSIIRLGTDKK